MARRAPPRGLRDLLPRETAKADARAAAEAARAAAKERLAAALTEVQATMATRLAALVAEGKLTQEQADRILARLAGAGPKAEATPDVDARKREAGAAAATISLTASSRGIAAHGR